MTERSSHKGFTLIELLISMAIGMIMIAAFPVMRGYVPEIQVNGAARSLAQDLREARSMAVQHGNDVVVAFRVEEGRIDFYSDSELDGIEIGDLIRSRPFIYYGSGVEYVPVTTTGVDGQNITAPIKFGSTSDPITLTFRANGSAINTGVIYLKPITSDNNSLGRAIEVYNTGTVITWHYQITGTPGPWEKWL